jgi:hypothetical protein
MHGPIPTYSHGPIPTYSHGPIPTYSHEPIPTYSHGPIPTYSHGPSCHGSYETREQHIHTDGAGFCKQNMFISHTI